MWKNRDPEQIASGKLQIFIYKNAHHGFNRELHKKLVRSTKKITIILVGPASTMRQQTKTQKER